MSLEELINLCQAVKHGDPRQVRNFKTGRRGAVIDVRGGELMIQAGKTTESWSYEDCE